MNPPCFVARRTSAALMFVCLAAFGPSLVPSLARAAVEPANPPAPRHWNEVAAVLARSAPPPADAPPMHVLLVAGPKDHGPGQHDYPAWQKAWAPLLARSRGVVVDTAFAWPEPSQWRVADVVVFYLHNLWSPAQIAELAAFQSRGGGVVTIHWAIDGGTDPQAFADRVGLAYTSKKYRHGVIDMRLTSGHEITQGMPERLTFHDESYWPFVGDPARIRVLGTSDELVEAGETVPEPVPVFWTYEPGQGRAFVCTLGHFMWSFDDPLFRLLLVRGIAWAARQPVTRLDALATDGLTLAGERAAGAEATSPTGGGKSSAGKGSGR